MFHAMLQFLLLLMNFAAFGQIVWVPVLALFKGQRMLGWFLFSLLWGVMTWVFGFLPYALGAGLYVSTVPTAGESVLALVFGVILPLYPTLRVLRLKQAATGTSRLGLARRRRAIDEARERARLEPNEIEPE